MRFPEQNPVPFTRRSILNLSADQLGWYALLRRGEYVCIGRGDIRSILLALVDAANCPRDCRPTHFVASVTPDAASLEPALLAALESEHDLIPDTSLLPGRCLCHHRLVKKP